MGNVYCMEVAGCKRELPLCRVTDDMYIAAFVMFGDVELTKACASALLEKAPAHDIMITAESKGIPLLYEMARQAGREQLYCCPQGSKAVYGECADDRGRFHYDGKPPNIVYCQREADAMRGKRILVIDDVISTGESLAALEKLIDQVGGEIVGRMAVLAEGDAMQRDDITCLAPRPLFNADGTAKE